MNGVPCRAGDSQGDQASARSHTKDQQRTYGMGRVCATPECETRLSSYNPSTICALHRGGWNEAPLPPRRPPRPHREITRTCAYEGCELAFTTTNPVRRYCSDSCRMKAFQARSRTTPPTAGAS